MHFIHQQYLKPAILGLVVGDALGVPFEFKRRDTFACPDMVGYGTHNQPAGTWSDDSSMVLATLTSFLECGNMDFRDIMQRFCDWLQKGEYCPHGVCFDAGGTTVSAISRYMLSGEDPTACGGKDYFDNGNGSLMRILPIVFVEHSLEDIYDLSRLTHAHEISLTCCELYLRLAENLMRGMPKEEAVQRLAKCEGACKRIAYIGDLDRSLIKSSGYVVDTLEAAVWCFLRTDSYRDCVTTAVELGEDTDTVAAVAGGLAGLYYGIGGQRGIPEAWIKCLARLDWINQLLEKAQN